MVTPSAGSVTYKYDALGRRIQRTPSNGTSTNFSYDGADVVRDKNSDATTVNYLNGPGIDNKIWQKGAAQYFFSQDHLGSTTALTNASGVLVERETYDAYGNTAGNSLTRYGYTGRERDSLTGLQYNRVRWYDAQLGRLSRKTRLVESISSLMWGITHRTESILRVCTKLMFTTI